MAGPSRAEGTPSAEGSEADRVLLVLPQPFFEERGTSIALAHMLHALSELRYGADFLSFPHGTHLQIPGVDFIRTRDPFGFRHIPIGFSLKKLLLDVFLYLRLRAQLKRRRYLYVHAVEEAAYMAALLRRKAGAFVLYDMASSLPEQLVQYRQFRTRPVQSLLGSLERWALRNVDLVVCSVGLEQKVSALAPTTPVRTWLYPSTLPMPDPDEVAHLRLELGLPSGSRVVLYIGSFAKYQGLHVLAAALPRVLATLPDVTFVLVGASNESELHSVRCSIASAFSNRVRVEPRVPRLRVPAYMGLADLLVSPRTHGSNLPLKAFEYLDSGKPIVASDIPAHRLFFVDGTALLVKPTPAALAEALIRVLSDDVIAGRLRDAAQAHAGRRFGWQGFVEFVGDLLREVQQSSYRATR